MESRGLELTVSLRDDILLQHLNQDLVFQLFYNLITNAIRYNVEGGKIHISDQLHKEEGYSVSIRDTGIGIPRQEHEAVFNRFRKSSITGTEGNGLGLSIVKSIVLYHGLGLELRSEPGSGSEFIIRFPASMLADPKK
jgi:signal transduction histidine kinase